MRQGTPTLTDTPTGTSMVILPMPANNAARQPSTINLSDKTDFSN
jgi:hypothetical protein